MRRRERLARWGDLLAREPQRMLKTLEEIDLRPAAQRAALRADNSPLTIAFADPVLRGEGLKGDTLGDAMAFFEMSEHQGAPRRVLLPQRPHDDRRSGGKAGARCDEPLARDRGRRHLGRGSCGAGGPAAVLTRKVARPRRRFRSKVVAAIEEAAMMDKVWRI